MRLSWQPPRAAAPRFDLGQFRSALAQSSVGSRLLIGLSGLDVERASTHEVGLRLGVLGLKSSESSAVPQPLV